MMNAKILYLSDKYASGVAGTKVSLFNELCRRGIDTKFETVHSHSGGTVDGERLLEQIAEEYTHVFVVNTWTKFHNFCLHRANDLGAKIVGFGLSDPNGWDPIKLENYNMYVSNNNRICEVAAEVYDLRSFYMPCSCDKSFHKNLNMEKDVDILFIGDGIHSFQGSTRIEKMKLIKKTFKDNVINIFGNSWGELGPTQRISGDRFILEINRARVGIDFANEGDSLNHRTFEFPACGTPIITRGREEVINNFEAGKNILCYNNEKEMLRCIEKVLNDSVYRNTLSEAMEFHVRTNHDISNRVDGLLHWLEKYG